jgi:hypothetical protein
MISLKLLKLHPSKMAQIVSNSMGYIFPGKFFVTLLTYSQDITSKFTTLHVWFSSTTRPIIIKFKWYIIHTTKTYW